MRPGCQVHPLWCAAGKVADGRQDAALPVASCCFNLTTSEVLAVPVLDPVTCWGVAVGGERVFTHERKNQLFTA